MSLENREAQMPARRGEGLGLQAAHVPPAEHGAPHQASPFEHLDVLGRGGERDRVRGGELADGPLALGEGAHHGAARGVGHRVEDRVELLNHSVEHSPRPGNRQPIG